MAVTNLWAVKRNVGAVIRYIENPEKTTSKEVEQVMSYIKDGSKTEEMMYVTGINCEADIAAEQFMQTKRLWGKEGGRAAYQGHGHGFRQGGSRRNNWSGYWQLAFQPAGAAFPEGFEGDCSLKNVEKAGQPGSFSGNFKTDTLLYMVLCY